MKKAFLQDRRLDHRVERVLQEAKAAGVQHFACNGCCEEDWMKVSGTFANWELQVCCQRL